MAYKKGREFEKETAALAGEFGKRNQKSGAIGTMEGVSALAGDAKWRFPWMRRTINIECKHGYGDSKEQKSIRIQQDWFDKHYQQSKTLKFIPMWAMKIKFSANKDKVSKFLIVPFDSMKEIIDNERNMWIELEELRKYKKGREGKNGNHKT